MADGVHGGRAEPEISEGSDIELEEGSASSDVESEASEAASLPGARSVSSFSTDSTTSRASHLISPTEVRRTTLEAEDTLDSTSDTTENLAGLTDSLGGDEAASADLVGITDIVSMAQLKIQLGALKRGEVSQEELVALIVPALRTIDTTSETLAHLGILRGVLDTALPGLGLLFDVVVTGKNASSTRELSAKITQTSEELNETIQTLKELGDDPAMEPVRKMLNLRRQALESNMKILLEKTGVKSLVTAASMVGVAHAGLKIALLAKGAAAAGGLAAATTATGGIAAGVALVGGIGGLARDISLRPEHYAHLMIRIKQSAPDMLAKGTISDLEAEKDFLEHRIDTGEGYTEDVGIGEFDLQLPDKIATLRSQIDKMGPTLEVAYKKQERIMAGGQETKLLLPTIEAEIRSLETKFNKLTKQRGELMEQLQDLQEADRQELVSVTMRLAQEKTESQERHLKKLTGKWKAEKESIEAKFKTTQADLLASERESMDGYLKMDPKAQDNIRKILQGRFKIDADTSATEMIHNLLSV